MGINITKVLSSQQIASKYESYKLGNITLNDFATLAIAKATARLKHLFVHNEIQEHYFEDLQSDLSVLVLQTLQTRVDINNPAAYFSRSADNLLTDWCRRLLIEVPTSSNLDDLAIDTHEVENLDLIEGICDTITDTLDSEIVRLKLQGHKQIYVANKLNQPPSTICFRLAKMEDRYNKNSKG